MSRITVKEAAKLTGMQPMTIYQQINRGTHVGQLFSKDKHGFYRAEESRVVFAGKEYKRKLIRGDKAKKIGFRVSPIEQTTIESNAEQAGVPVAEWCRKQALDTLGPSA